MSRRTALRNPQRLRDRGFRALAMFAGAVVSDVVGVDQPGCRSRSHDAAGAIYGHHGPRPGILPTASGVICVPTWVAARWATHVAVGADLVSGPGLVVGRGPIDDEERQHATAGDRRARDDHGIGEAPADRHVRGITTDGQLLRDFTLDPTRDYQPRGVKPGPKPRHT